MRRGKSPQNINEELNKMRRLMSFSINENSHDSLAEENFNKSTEGKNSDPEGEECDRVYGGPPETAFQMSNELNILLEKEFNRIEGETKIKLVATNPDNIYFEMGGVKLSLTQNSSGFFMFEIRNQYIPFATNISVSLVREELLKDRCFKLLYDRYDSIKNQIDNEIIKMRLTPQGAQPIRITMMMVGDKRKLKKAMRKSGGKLLSPENISLLSFNQKFFIKLNEKLYAEIESSFGINLTKIQINGAELPNDWGQPDNDVIGKKCYCDNVDTGEKVEYPCGGELPPECQPKDIYTPIELKLDLVDAYEFDQVENSDGTSYWNDGGKQFQKFIDDYQDSKEIYNMVWDDYLNFLRDKGGVTVEGYASIDANEDEDMIGKYIKCNVDKKLGGTKQPRKDYNICLSQKRAEQVIKDIVSIYPELDGILKPKGMGATDKFNGKSWPNSNEDETAPNRRVRAVFPVYETKIKD